MLHQPYNAVSAPFTSVQMRGAGQEKERAWEFWTVNEPSSSASPATAPSPGASPARFAPRRRTGIQLPDREAARPRRENGRQLESDIVLPLDVAHDTQIQDFFDALAARWDEFDILVHSVAYAPAGQLTGRYLDAVDRRESASPTIFPATALPRSPRPAGP